LDGSEKIRYTEFLAATIEASGTVSEVKLAEAFDRLDSDDSGYISVENLLEILGDNFTKEDVQAMINEVTVKNGQISYSQFLSLWESTEPETFDEDDATTDALSGNAFGHRHDPFHRVIETVNVRASTNPFLDSERSFGAISILSCELDDDTTEPNNVDNVQNDAAENTNISRANFLQGKMLSERNMMLFDQLKKHDMVSCQ
jgi:EF-hand domain pair